MTIKGVLWRFALAYVVAVIIVGYIANYFGIKSSSGLNIGILAGCVVWVCSAFGKANKRYFTGAEKMAVVLGLIFIDVAIQVLFSLAAISQRDPVENFGSALLIAVVFVGALHAIAIYLFVGLAKKPLIKQGVIDG